MARKGVGEMLEFGGGGQDIDGEDVKAEGDIVAVGFGELAEVGGGHEAKLALLVGVDSRFSWGHVMSGAGFDFEEDEGVAVPGDEVEVGGKALGAPAAGDDGIAEVAEVEEGSVFAALAGEEVRREWGFAVGASAEVSVEAAFEGKQREPHLDHLAPKARAARKTRTSSVFTILFHAINSSSARLTASLA